MEERDIEREREREDGEEWGGGGERKGVRLTGRQRHDLRIQIRPRAACFGGFVCWLVCLNNRGTFPSDPYVLTK